MGRAVGGCEVGGMRAMKAALDDGGRVFGVDSAEGDCGDGDRGGARSIRTGTRPEAAEAAGTEAVEAEAASPQPV